MGINMLNSNKAANTQLQAVPGEEPILSPTKTFKSPKPKDAFMPASIGMIGKIGREEIDKAILVLQDYKRGKSNLEQRIIENEQWWKLRHWEMIRKSKTLTDPEPASAWLFNSIANKHADAMDNFPDPKFMPREATDKTEANMLSSVVPVILEQNDYEQTYSDMWWYKLKTGTGVVGAFWNPKKLNGLGDIDIKKLDLLNLFWEPGIMDIQKSRNFFNVELVDNDILEMQYPHLKNKLSSPTINVATYLYDDTVDTSGKSAVVDWYYKLFNGTKEVLHYCKFTNGELLYASENDPAYMEKGFYDHGKYPFVFDVLFVEEGSPCGFGYIDIMKDPQMYIDKLNQVILKNALMASRPRYFVRGDSGINEAEFADLSKDIVHTATTLGDDCIKPIQVNTLSDVYLSVLINKIDELKETSGNRDFSQGGTSGGVTAASAIAALQEAGSKLSRDMIKSAYRAFKELNYINMELIRQFYDEPRCFRITGEQGKEEFAQYSNRGLQPKAQGTDFGIDMGYRLPVFDIKIISQKSNPFSKIAQNELAMEFFGKGFFDPANADSALACIEMMDFEGKNEVTTKIAKNGTLMQTVERLQEQMAMIIGGERDASGKGVGRGKDYN